MTIVNFWLTDRHGGIESALHSVFAWLIDRSDFPTPGIGLWWAIQTVTTVGYGDVTPSHTEGKVIAAVVMLTGIGFLAVITSAITATFVEKTRERIKGSTEKEILERLDEMNARLARLEERDGSSGPGKGDRGTSE